MNILTNINNLLSKVVLLAGENPEAPDLTAPSKYIGGVLLAIISAFTGLAAIITLIVLVIIFIRLKAAAATGNIAQQKKAGKDIIIAIVCLIGFAIAAPLCGLFSYALLGTNPIEKSSNLNVVVNHTLNYLSWKLAAI